MQTIIEFIFTLIYIVLILRTIIPIIAPNRYNSFTDLIYKYTNPFLSLLKKKFPNIPYYYKDIDLSALYLVFILKLVELFIRFVFFL